MMFVRKVHKQHNSLVMTIPVDVCRALGIVKGDYVVLSDHTTVKRYPIFYLEKWRQDNDRTKKHTGRKGKGR